MAPVLLICTRKGYAGEEEAVLTPEPASAQAPVKKTEPRPVYSPEQISGLAGDEDFPSSYILPRNIWNKVFTQQGV